MIERARSEGTVVKPRILAKLSLAQSLENRPQVSSHKLSIIIIIFLKCNINFFSLTEYPAQEVLSV